jgi:hypothetical protein
MAGDITITMPTAIFVLVCVIFVAVIGLLVLAILDADHG